MENELINLSFYSFSPLSDLPGLRVRLKSFCVELGLMGTVLIAPEGTNAGVSGTRESIDRFKEFVRTELGVKDSTFKEAPVPTHSFKRMLVKIKKEIITIGDNQVRPDQKTAERISAAELKKWLDEKRPFVLLDTRNQYEINVGTFEGAEDLGIDMSREFAQKAPTLVEKYKDQKVVTFCTGGIRCEKASALLLKLGMTDVYQLDGGILRYLEENGPAHFKGNCFVFDWRLAVDGELKPVVRSTDPEAEFGRHQL